jgi:hypothetical protein
MSAALRSLAGAHQPDPTFTERCFRLDAEADPGLLLRALGLFAKLNLVPNRVAADYAGGRLTAEIRVAGLDDGQSDHIAKVMAGLFGVECVILT